MTEPNPAPLANARTFALAPKTLAKLLRFAAVGALSGGIYALVVALCVSGFSLDPRFASGLGYLASLPVNFAGNRKFTFLGQGPIAFELLRFLLVHGANIAAAVLVMTVAVREFGLHYLVGVAATILVIPFITFLIMDRWVFRKIGNLGGGRD